MKAAWARLHHSPSASRPFLSPLIPHGSSSLLCILYCVLVLMVCCSSAPLLLLFPALELLGTSIVPTTCAQVIAEHAHCLHYSVPVGIAASTATPGLTTVPSAMAVSPTASAPLEHDAFELTLQASWWLAQAHNLSASPGCLCRRFPVGPSWDEKE